MWIAGRKLAFSGFGGAGSAARVGTRTEKCTRLHVNQVLHAGDVLGLGSSNPVVEHADSF